jgi:hypothetical protein
MPTFVGEYNQRNNDIKSSTIQGYMVQGNMKLNNSSINMRVKAKDHLLHNNRAQVATPMSQTPSINNMGQTQGLNSLYHGIQSDRNTADITEVLKKNPYAISYKFNN